jgi:DNA polymerase-3 subunit alpha
VRIRPHQTRTGKSMGFVTIEDVQGTIDLVIFPRTWSRLGELIEYDKIILVDGKADVDGAEPKVLVDNISTDFKMVETDNSQTLPPPPPPATSHVVDTLSDQEDDAGPDDDEDLDPDDILEIVSDSELDSDRSPSELQYPEDGYDDDMPPPPDTFPPDFEGMYAAVSEYEDISLGQALVKIFTPSDEDASALGENPSASQYVADDPDGENATGGEATLSKEDPENEPVEDESTIATERLGAESPSFLERPETGGTSGSEPGAIDRSADAPAASNSVKMPNFLVSPVKTVESDDIQMVTVVLRSSSDKTRDVLRLRRIHGTLMSYSGKDRFALHVFEFGRGYLVEFPNFTTGVCPELISKLKLLVGSDNVRQEKITFQ